MTLKWTRRALRDVRHLHEYVSEANPDAARSMVARVGEAVDRLRQYPQQGKPGRVAETRELVLAGTPYIIVYRIEGGEVQVVAVLHGARRWPDTF